MPGVRPSRSGDPTSDWPRHLAGGRGGGAGADAVARTLLLRGATATDLHVSS
uniref:Uncharacterized protein n=1 Tax=Nonomuraea gerenzanensis TaxID=93944 RepID=A0A1M4EKK6_9ACTN|nr:hypothetical protein BN4615_P8882 [Nonomuraea gerenzanensis]